MTPQQVPKGTNVTFPSEPACFRESEVLMSFWLSNFQQGKDTWARAIDSAPTTQVSSRSGGSREHLRQTIEKRTAPLHFEQALETGSGQDIPVL